eukprot:scaffold1179_cov221-Prasinococcus_capsulatus_cf.AAC.1
MGVRNILAMVAKRKIQGGAHTERLLYSIAAPFALQRVSESVPVSAGYAMFLKVRGHPLNDLWLDSHKSVRSTTAVCRGTHGVTSLRYLPEQIIELPQILTLVLDRKSHPHFNGEI